jgi:hypothetical protein
MRHTTTAASIALALAATGCADTYKGAGVSELPASQISVLQNNTNMGVGGLNILEVDGKHRGNGFFRKFELTPGQHRIKFEWLGFGKALEKGNNIVELEFTAEPAQVYEIKFNTTKTEPGKGIFRSWIEDIATNRAVSRVATIQEPAASPQK